MTKFKTNSIDNIINPTRVFDENTRMGAIEKKLRHNINDRSAIVELQQIVADINSYLRITPVNKVYEKIALTARKRYNAADRSGVEDVEAMAFILTFNKIVPVVKMYCDISEFIPESITGKITWNNIVTRTNNVWFRDGYKIVKENISTIPGFSDIVTRIVYDDDVDNNTSVDESPIVDSNLVTQPDVTENIENVIEHLIASGKFEQFIQNLTSYMRKNNDDSNIDDSDTVITVEPEDINDVTESSSIDDTKVDETIDPDNTIVSDTFVMNVSEENTSGDEVLEPVQDSKEVKSDELENRQREYLDPYFNNNEACAANFPSIRRLTRLIHDLDMHVDYFPLDGIDMHRVFGAKLIKNNQVLRNILIDPNGIYRNGINVIDTTYHPDDIYNAYYIPLNDKEHLTKYLLGNFTDDDRAETEADIPENIANVIERVDLSNLPKLKYKNWKYFIMNLSSMIRRAPKDAFFKLTKFDSTKDFMIEACGPEFNIYLNREINTEAVKNHITNRLVGEYSPDKHGKKRFTFQNLSSSVKTA